MATEQLRLVDGTIVRKCPTDKPLYCSREGKFYSVHRFRTGASYPCGVSLTDDGWILREIKPNIAQAGTRKCTHTNGNGTHYPFLRQFGAKHCHFLVAGAWYGPRPEGMVIDHLNGDILNWSADNLEYVTPKENIKRAKLLRILRSNGRDPRKMSREELLNIFKRYEFEDPAKRMEYEMSHHCEE